ncbi:MAG: hypothetical protein ACLVJO_08960 [[Clostridium] scindens]
MHVKADIIFMLLPDEFAPKIFEESIVPGLEEGNIINFCFCLQYYLP